MGLREFIEQAKRLYRLAKKPTKEEIIRTAKITGMGIAILGLIGYVIHWIYYLITQM